MVKESIHQEFGRFLRDEMDDIEREKYIYDHHSGFGQGAVNHADGA